MTMDASRRAFLKRSAALSVAGGATPFVMNLAAIGEAAAATATDYKALVCVFLYGGNDYANTVTPYDATSYADYQRLRSVLALGRDALTPTLLNPTTPLPGGRQFALAPTLAPLLQIFDAGKLAVMLNVGTLVRPTTKAEWTSKTAKLPPKLFSHNDQQSFWQSSNPEGATSGWGGRIGDLLQSGNGTAALTCINASGNAVFLSGKQAVQYSAGTNGPVALTPSSLLYGSAAGATALKSIMSGSRVHVLENEHSRISKRSLDLSSQVTSALAGAPAFTGNFPTGNSLADQLRAVARMIAVSSELNAKRQVFFVSMGGFDLHDTLPAKQPALLANVANAMKAFYDTTVQLGVSNQVTTFTASDFGRTLVANTDGSDHGWGSMHFAMGGAVKGKAFYGTAPVMADNGPSDVGQGRLLPSVSVDQYAATMASWFGVSESDMATVLPNIGNYDVSTRNLGFV